MQMQHSYLFVFIVRKDMITMYVQVCQPVSMCRNQADPRDDETGLVV